MKAALLALAIASAAGAIDLSKEITARWPSAERLDLLREAGVTVVVLPAGAAEALVAQVRAAGFSEVAVETSFAFLGPEEIGRDVSGAYVVLRAGLWPGVRSGPNVEGRGIEVSSASREPWVDSNPYLIAYLRGKFPQRPALLGYRPDAAAGISGGRAVPYETLELALVEATAAGGNFILSLPDDYRSALLSGEARAQAAWRSLAQTTQFLRQHREWYARPNRARVAVVAGTLAESGELLNLMYRRNLCPVVAPAEALPALDPARFRAVVAANVAPPNPGPLLDYARGGGLLIAAGRQPWWNVAGLKKTRGDEDRDHYALGRGRLIAYRKPIADPSEFAMDVVDAVGVRTRDARLWNAPAVVALAAGDPASPQALLHLINYGDPIGEEFPARVEGAFRTATLHEPGAPPRPLAAARRGAGTEVAVDRLSRFAVIVLE